MYLNFDKIRYISKRNLAKVSQKLLFSALLTDYKAYLTKHTQQTFPYIPKTVSQILFQVVIADYSAADV
jgi:hypothetical protein